MKLRKGMTFHTEDNTTLFCPTASYKYNYGTYRKWKIGLLAASIAGIVIGVAVIVNTTSSSLQTIVSTVVGAFAGILTWILTSFVTDKIQYEKDELDRLVYVVERHIEYLSLPFYGIDYSNPRIVELPDNNVYIKMVKLAQACANLMAEKEIDSTDLRLRWHKQDYTLEGFLNLVYAYLNKEQELTDKDNGEVDYNLHELKMHLELLRDKLLRYKTYTAKKNPPISYEEMKRIYDKKNDL